MTPIDEKLLEIRESVKNGYSPLVDYGSWRVAVLNYSPELRPENIKTMQRHNETDEVFVLLSGRCILFVAGGEEAASDIYVQEMKPCQVYNVKKAVWHNHVLSEDARVLIVENRDTTFDNSPFCQLTGDQQKTIIALAGAAGF
jgi:ureidoglycolate hydrolase